MYGVRDEFVLFDSYSGYKIGLVLFEDPSHGEIERKGSEKAHNHKCYQANLAK